MQMFYDLFYNLENIEINIYKLTKHFEEYLWVSTFPTVMESWLLVVIIGYHGISAVIHKNLRDFLVNILKSDRDLGWYMINVLKCFSKHNVLQFAKQTEIIVLITLTLPRSGLRGWIER